MALTPKQLEFARHRAAGFGQRRAAVEAGYAPGSAKVTASKLEHRPDIRAAIDAARKAAKAGHADDAPPEFEGAEDYLLAVVQGKAPPDPVRVGAARALLPYMAPRKRATARSATPKQMQASAAHSEDRDARAAWAAKSAAVRARLKAV